VGGASVGGASVTSGAWSSVTDALPVASCDAEHAATLWHAFTLAVFESPGWTFATVHV
jgi:hypothetical protein